MLFFKKVLQLLHEQLALELVLLVVQVVELPERELACEPLLEGTVHAIHIDGQLDDLANLAGHVVERFLDKALHLQEVTGDEDGDSVLDLDLWLFAVDVSHQPVKDVDVAVHADIDVVGTLGVREILLEVFHVRDEQLFVAFEVLV